MTRTHQDFKSVNPRVRDAEDMEESVGGALSYQYMFERRTSPWEKQLWGHDELTNFKLELEEVDRLYYIYDHDDGYSGRQYAIAARVDHQGQSLYVELSAGCDYTGFDCQGDGIIYVSRDPNLFLKVVLTEEYETELIRQSLAEDGIETDDLADYDRHSFIKSVDMLKLLCHKAVYNHREQLEEHCTSALPNILKKSVDEFIKTQEAIRSYDDFD